MRVSAWYLPDADGWRSAAPVAIIGGIALTATAWVGGLAEWNPSPLGFSLLATALFLFVVPSLVEESIFRGLLHPRSKSGRMARIGAVAALFVLFHPLQYWTGIGPAWSAQFATLPFLAAVSVVAVTLGVMRERSMSIWPGALFHWIVVASWKFVFGGPF